MPSLPPPPLLLPLLPLLLPFPSSPALPAARKCSIERIRGRCWDRSHRQSVAMTTSYLCALAAAAACAGSTGGRGNGGDRGCCCCCCCNGAGEVTESEDAAAAVCPIGVVALVEKSPHLWPCTVVRSSKFVHGDDDDDDDDEDDRLQRTFARKVSSSGSDG
jgi:hypothetical protein